MVNEFRTLVALHFLSKTGAPDSSIKTLKMHSENYIYYPEQLTGEELDAFLEMGWYRMGQSLFTTHFLFLDETIYRVFWLRYDLKELVLSNTQRRLKKRNEQFNVSVKPLEITDELEELYALYKTALDFSACAIGS